MISFFKDRANIYSWEKSKNDKGITSKTPIIKYENIKCTLDQKSVSTMSDDPITRSEVRYTLFISNSLEVKAGDKIEITSRNLVFRAKKPFNYPFLKKQEIELEAWEE